MVPQWSAASHRLWSVPGWRAATWHKQWPSEWSPFVAAGTLAAESPLAADPASGFSAAGPDLGSVVGPDLGSAVAEKVGYGAAAPAGGGFAAGWAVPG